MIVGSIECCVAMETAGRVLIGSVSVIDSNVQGCVDSCVHEELCRYGNCWPFLNLRLATTTLLYGSIGKRTRAAVIAKKGCTLALKSVALIEHYLSDCLP